MDTPQLEQYLRDYPGVHEGVVLSRRSVAGIVQRVAYVVVNGPQAIDRLRLAIGRDAGADVLVLGVSVLPLDASGRLDTAALHSLALIDNDLLATAEAEAQALRPGRRLAALGLSQAVKAPPHHLGDLLPDWQRFGRHAAGAAAPSPVQRSGPGDGAWALSDGGALCLAPDAPTWLGETLIRAARIAAPAGVLCKELGGDEVFITYAELLATAQRILGGLQGAGVQRGDHLVFHIRRQCDFFEAFWACVLGGFVPVPTPVAASYHEINGNVRRLGDAVALVAAETGSAVILTDESLQADLRMAARLLGTDAWPTLAVEALRLSTTVPLLQVAAADDVALMMLTSGSTGRPKGVPQPHCNLLARGLGSCQRNGFHPGVVSLNWMPLDHVAGLIYFHLRDVHLACRQVHVATELVLRDPLLWLDMLDRERVNVTFAPNFAFGLVVGAGDQIASRHWDLSCVREVLNGGEAIVATSARKFLRLMMARGLPADAMVPAWGMSETSSGVTYSRDFRLETTADTDTHVQVGHPLPGVRLRIVDDNNQLLHEGQVGQLQIAGVTLFHGYYAAAQPLAETFTADGWFRTGDLGRLDGGSLSITGREKDVIIINGANYAGPAIENAVDDIDGVLRSFTAACGVADQQADGQEALAVFFVPQAGLSMSDERLAELLRAIRQSIARAFGISPAFVVPLARDDIPKTSIGKIQRGALQKGLTQGRFEAELRRVDLLISNANTLPSWFFRRRWQAKALGLAAGKSLPGAVILVGQGEAAGAALLERLQAAGVPWLTAADDRPPMWPGTPGGGHAQLVFWFDHRGADPVQRLADNAARLAEWVRCLPAAPAASGIAVVLYGDADIGTDAAVAACVHAMAQEHAGLQARCIDVSGLAPAAAAAAVLDELMTNGQDREIAYRGGQRGVPVLVPDTLSAPTGERLRRGGRYLVSGGAGGVGVVLAAWLLQAQDAQVLLVGRSAETVAAALARLRDLSPRVDAVVADVADVQALRTAVQPVLDSWDGPLDAAFHLAGAYHEAAWADESLADMKSVLSGKLGGALALQSLLHGHPGAALVLFSSVSSVFGGALIGAYAMANRALDAMATSPGAGRVHSLAWSAWRDLGLNRQFGAGEPLRAMGVRELTPEQALTSLRIALAQAPGLMVIGLDGENPFVQRHLDHLALTQRVQVFVEAPADESLPDDSTVSDRFGSACTMTWRAVAALPQDELGQVDRLALRHVALHEQAFRIPTGATERRLADLWRRILGIDQVSTDASFFELGGQSLLATQLLSAIGQQFGVRWALRDVFAAPTVAAQALRIDADLAAEAMADHDAVPAATPWPLASARPDVDRRMPMASAQQRLWFLDRIHPHNPAFHIPAAICFASAPPPALVRRCLQALVDRHESLRTTFPEADGQPCQQIAHSRLIDLPVDTLSPADDMAALEAAEALRPFDLSAGPLFRARLVLCIDGRAVLLLTLHHIISDGWSMRVLFQQFLAFWRTDGQDTLPPPVCQFGDFTEWQRQQLASPAIQAQVTRWRQRLAGNLHGFSLPTDLPRPAVQTYRGARHVARLGGGLARRVRSLASGRGVTLFVTLLAVYKTVLSRYAQQSDIVVGTVFANRNRAEFDDLIGFVVNVLALRTDLAGDPRFADVLQRLQKGVLDVHADHEVPFEALVDLLQPPRDTSRSPLFQIAFDMRDPKIVDSPVAGVSLAVMEPDLGACQFDLHLTFEERGDELIGYWQFNTDLFRPATIARMAANFETLLDAVCAQPDLRLSALPLCSADEQAQLRAWNACAAPYFAGSFHGLFEQQVDREPDAPALWYRGQTVSYRQLDDRANCWAHELRALGVATGGTVGVMTERSIEMVVAILATLKAGAAYLPLDPAYPADRLRFMLQDSQVAWVLTQARLSARLAELGGAQALLLDNDPVARHPAGRPQVNVSPDDLAYLIYTSGSTGRPKGVQVPHRGWCNVAQAEHDVLGMRPGMRVLQFASLSFDASAYELAMALGNGGTLVIGDAPDVMPGPGLAALLRLAQVQVITVPPSSLAALDGDFPDLRIITVAGEACPAAVVDRWARAPVRFFNLYGPTETTIWATYAECRAAPPGVVSPPPPIGRPVPNFEIHLLDGHGKALPIGMPGELYIGGAGVARGYLGRPELNSVSFVADRFSGRQGARLYRSGDLARFNDSGALEFLGRADHQVKLRGFRIELGEIEAALHSHPAVQEAVVMARRAADGDMALAAYVSPPAGHALPAAADLRRHLGLTLPSHMVPAHVVVLPAMPMTPNGKVDRAALPDPLDSHTGSGGDAVELPQGVLETLIAEVWQQVLDRRDIDRRTNFFEAGGHSLKMARVHSLLSARIARPLSLVDLFQYPNIASLAAFLAQPTPAAPQGAAKPVPAPAVPAAGGADAQRIAALARLQRAARDRGPARR